MEIRPLSDVENDHIADALVATEGNIDRCATALGIGRNTLYRKIRAILATRGIRRTKVATALGNRHRAWQENP